MTKLYIQYPYTQNLKYKIIAMEKCGDTGLAVVRSTCMDGFLFHVISSTLYVYNAHEFLFFTV